VHALDALKQLGMPIVLDDFGEGYSSITRLGRLPFDMLKVDLSLVGLPSASDGNRILKAMIQLAHSLGLQIVAECIEDDEIRDELTRLGCDLIEGFSCVHRCRPTRFRTTCGTRAARSLNLPESQRKTRHRTHAVCENEPHANRLAIR
jgi:EAL domain-containing protein (putative c-di-GMP-specific phosphodiesterase class I)